MNAPTAVNRGGIVSAEQIQASIPAELRSRGAPVAAVPRDRLPAHPGDLLTERDTTILRMLAEGLSYSAIATRTQLADGTVRQAASRAFAKLGVSTGPQAVAVAYQRGLLGDQPPAPLDRPDFRAVQDGTAPEPDAADLADTEPAAPPVDEPETTPEPDSFDELLAAGDASHNAKTRLLASRIRLDVAALRGRLRDEQEETAARGRVADARRQLDAAVAELARLTGTKAVPGATGTDTLERTRTVRAWAATNNVACPKVGRVPRTVMDAWRAAGSPQ